MWFHLSQIEEKIKQRKNQTRCKRCCLLYNKTLTECPRCTGIPDQQLQGLLEQRKQNRLRLSKVMIILMLLFIGLIIFANR